METNFALILGDANHQNRGSTVQPERLTLGIEPGISTTKQGITINDEGKVLRMFHVFFDIYQSECTSTLTIIKTPRSTYTYNVANQIIKLPWLGIVEIQPIKKIWTGNFPLQRCTSVRSRQGLEVVLYRSFLLHGMMTQDVGVVQVGSCNYPMFWHAQIIL